MIKKIEKRSNQYLSKTYFLNNKSINISVLISSQNPNMVHGEMFRTNPKIANASISTISLVDPKEYFNEMDFIFKSVEQFDPTDPNIVIALKGLCDGHINGYGRMIDVDLETYLDRVLKFSNSIGQIKTKEDGIYIRKELRTFIIDEIKDSLWVNVHSSSESYFDMPTLTKYTELSNSLRSSFINQ